MKFKILILFLLTFLLSTNTLVLAENEITVSVSKNPVAVGETFQIIYHIQINTQGNFNEPHLTGFTIENGPVMQNINGKMSVVYEVSANKEGNFTIPSASVVTRNQKFTSNTTTVTVKGKLKEKSESQNADEIIRKNIFMRVNVNKKSVYQGEQLVATYKLYINPQLRWGVKEQPSPPSFNGFWSQEILNNTNNQQNQNRSSETINGVTYSVFTLKKVVLLPQKSGTLYIEPMSVSLVVQLEVSNKKKRRRDPFGFDDSFFDSFFNRNTKNFDYTAKTERLAINVNPLPDNQPADFSGGVGKMQLEAWLDKKQTKTNEPVTLKIKITGSGNMKLVDALNIQIPPDFETYEPKIADNLQVTEAGINGSKIFEYLLVPRHSGEYKIGPLSFSYFDLTKKQYVSLSSPEFLLNVEKGAANENVQVVSGVNKEDIKYLAKDIRYIKTANKQFNTGYNSFYGSLIFILLILLALVTFSIFIFLYKKNKELYQNKALLRNKKATQVARKRLATAKKYLSASNHDLFYEELSKGLWGYLSDKLVIPFSELTKDKAAELLQNKNISEVTINKMKITIDNCEFARYAPSSDTFEMENVYSDSVNLITELEGKLK